MKSNKEQNKMNTVKKLMVAAFAAVFGLCGLKALADQVVSEDVKVFAFGNYVKLIVPGVDHTRYEISTNGVPMTSGGKSDGEFYVPADAIPVTVTYTPAPGFQFNPPKTEWEKVYGSDDMQKDEITLTKQEVLEGIGEITTRPVKYFVWDEAQKTLVAQTCTSYEVVTADMKSLYADVWYAVIDDVVIDGGSHERPGLLVNGNVHLILCDGASLVVTGGVSGAGIEVPTTASLSIYGQAGCSGALTATGNGTGAGIGGGSGFTCGRVTIHGGTVTATGDGGSAGIGGGDCGAGGTVTINGGTVTANGGMAGIGGGLQSTSGTVTINGGFVIANGGAEGAGIGGGWKGRIASVTVAGGTVIANGGEYGAGIGGGRYGNGCAVTIIAGDVTAIGDEKGGEGIGKGAGAVAAAYGTFALGPFTEATILAGMDPTGINAQPVAAENFANQGEATGWHAQRYVHMTAVKLPAPGSPEKPWDVGTSGNGQPQAYTNGNNEVIVKGEGLPKPYGGEGDPAPWADAEPPIETIYVPQNTEDIYKHQWPDDADKINGLPDYLSFTAKDGDVKISFGKNYSETYGLEYSFDPLADEWTVLPEFDLNGSPSDSDKVLVANGQTLYIRKMGDEVTLGVGASGGYYGTFKMERVENDTATVEAGGNVMSLLDQTCRSKEVDIYAFYYLFCDCSILTTAPKLPATKLGVKCYEFMFGNCSALKAAPELPATELESGCYCYMFYGCSALESIELPASELKEACYRFMFQYCSKLSMVKVGFDAWSDLAYVCEDWLFGVAATGTFICSQALENDFAAKGLSYGASTIPVNWRVARDYLSFTAKGGDITLSIVKDGTPVDVAFEYSFNAGAESWTTYSEPIQITKDQTVYFRKQGEAVTAISSENGYWQFKFDGAATVAAGGNVMSMLDPTCQSREIGAYGLKGLFGECGRLVSAPKIEADTIGAYGCADMFRGCTSLTAAPVIVACELDLHYAICLMFKGAGSLNEITVCFTNWFGERTSDWVQNVAPFGVFRCPSVLPIEVGTSRIPEGWIVFKKFSIPAIEGLSHVVTNSAGEVIAPCAVSQDGTKTYEVLAGEEETYAVDFWDVDGYPVAGKVPLDLGNLKEKVEIGSDKYPLPERGVLLTVEGAPEHSKFTIYCNEEEFAEGGANDLTTRVPSNVTTKVVYSTTDDGWAYAFENGQPVTELVQLEDCYVTATTEVSAPTELPDNYKQVLEKVDEFENKVNQFFGGLSGYPSVVQNEAKMEQDAIEALVTMIKANPLPSDTKLAELENAENDFDAWSVQLKKDADEFVAALKEAEEKTKAAADELKKLGTTKYYEEKGAALIKTAQDEIEKIRSGGKPPVKDQTANLKNAMKAFDANLEKLKAEVAAFNEAKAAAKAKLELVQKNNDELLKIPKIAYRWGKMVASQDPAVQKDVNDIWFSMMNLKTNLEFIKASLAAAQNADDVSKVSADTANANDALEAIRTRILSYQIPTYQLTVNVVNWDKVTYSVYTGETAQVAIIEKANKTASFYFVWETPVKVVYHLTDEWYAFDEATDKTVREFVALDALKEMMQHDRQVDEPALGYLKELVGTYDGAMNQFADWEKDADSMPGYLKEEIMGYITEARAKVEELYAKGVPVGQTCGNITTIQEDYRKKLEPLFEQGYRQLAQERGSEFQDKYNQFLNDNNERINEISKYGTPETQDLLKQIDQLKANCEYLINQINSGSINNKAAYEALLGDKQKLEGEMDNLAKKLSEAVRYVTALPISADRNFDGIVAVRSYQGLVAGETQWICLWCPNYLEGEALWRAENFIGRKFHEVLAEELYQGFEYDGKMEYCTDWSLGNRYLPEGMAVCVIAALDDQGTITRVGGVGGLDALELGEVKGSDIVGGGAMSISYFMSKSGDLYPQTAMALPLTSGGEVTLGTDKGPGYYAVLGDCEITSLTVKGDVWLILGRGCDFSVLDGIVLEEGSMLHICSEHDFRNDPHLMGRMTVAKMYVDPDHPAAICGHSKSLLEIHGGMIDISSAAAGIKVGQFLMNNGDVTVTGGEGYAGVDLSGVFKEASIDVLCEVQAGTLNVTGGAGAAAIGGNVGQGGGIFRMHGGLVRADATTIDDKACGAGIGAGVNGGYQGAFENYGKLTVFVAPNATSKMKVTGDYINTREPSVLITAGGELIQPLPFTLNKNGNYNLQMPGLPRSQYVAFALTKDDLARAYGEGSTVGAEIWKTVSRIATGDRVAVGEITRVSLERSFHEMGVKTIYISYSQSDVCDVYSYGDIAMIVAFDCDEQNQVVRLGGVNLPDSMTDGTTIESAIGREAIGALTFQLYGEKGTIKLQNLSEEPGEDETFFRCCYSKKRIAELGMTEADFAAAIIEKIGHEVGTVPAYWISDMADDKSDSRAFDQGLYTVAVAMILDAHKQVKRIGVATGIETLTDGQIQDNDVARIGAQSFFVRADNFDWATIRMPGTTQQGQAWLWVRVSDESKYEELDAFINGLIGQRVGAEGATLRPLDASAIPAMFGKGNWGLFAGDNVQISRYDAKNGGSPMRGVVVFKVVTLPTSVTGSEMMILTVGGVKNVDKLTDGQQLSNQYGEDVDHIVNQPFTVTRQGEEERSSLQVVPEGELPENGSWYYLTINQDVKFDLTLDERLLTYLGAAVGDLTVGTLGNWGYWPSSTTESSFTVPSDTEAVYLFMADANDNILAIGLADELKKLYEPGMSKGDTFGKTFIAAQDFGVTRAGDVRTASVFAQDAVDAEVARDRFVCFTYEDAKVANEVFKQLPTILNGAFEVGTCTLASLGGVQPKMLGTFTTDEMSLELPAGYQYVFVARVHGAGDTIVTLGGIYGLDTIADGETARPDNGFCRILPFDFTVTRAENGTFSLKTEGLSGERRPNEQWLWVAVPSHVRYVMEPQFESSERLLERLRREMVEMVAGTETSWGRTALSNPETLQVLLGEGYYGMSLDTALSVEQIPADTEVVLVFKIDRATGGTCGEGAVIGLNQLAPGQNKRNQVTGRISYVEVDADGNRTMKETVKPVDPITELTTSIGGGRWYVMTDCTMAGQLMGDGGKRITVDGEANIILLDSRMGENVKFSIAAFNGGFAVNEGATLNIYGQQSGNGVLQVAGADGCAAIGGDEGCGCGTINISGGVVLAEAGVGAASIGGGYLNGAKNGTVNLYGGIVMAVAGDAAAIGGGLLGCGCDVNLYPAVTLFCVNEGNEVTPGVGGCDGLGNGSVTVHGENRVYLEADEALTPHPYDYYFGDVRNGNLLSTELLTVSLPKDERLQYNVESMTLGGDFGGVLPGEDAYTYKVLRGDTIVVTAETIGKDGLVNYGFRSPRVFKFDCVQSDVTLSTDDLKVAPLRGVTPMDFTVSRDKKFNQLSLRVNETFAPGELLVWGVVPEEAKLPIDDPMIMQMFNDPVGLLYKLLNEGISVGEACCDQYAMMLGAKNWNIVFDYAGQEIPLPENARHVLAFKVFDAGRYAALARSGGKILKAAKKNADGRLALIKVGAIDDAINIQPEKPLYNQVGNENLIARQPFSLTRNADETFQLTLVGQLNVGIGEKWGFATINSEKLAMIESGALGDITLDELKMMLDGMIGRPIGTLRLTQMSPLFSKIETSDSNVFTCPADTAAVVAFKTCKFDKGDFICTLGYALSNLQAMAPGGTERKGNEIDGETDAPSYFVTIENIPEGVKGVNVTYAIGEDGRSVDLSPDILPKGTAQFVVPEGANVEIDFVAAGGKIFRTKDCVRIKAIHQDEIVDASFLVLVDRKIIMPQYFDLRRNWDKTFTLEMPEVDFDAEKGDRWFYLALNAQEIAMSVSDGQPAGIALWLLANQMIGREVGSDDLLTTAYFTIAMRNGYSGYTTERFIDLPADADMLIVCRCFDVTAEDGFTITYVETVGGCRNLQQTGSDEVRGDEMNYPFGGDTCKTNYQKWDKAKCAFVSGGTVVARMIDDDTATVGNNEWYVVPPMMEVACDTITVQGTANVIVGDLATFELDNFVVEAGATLNVYGQDQRLGTLVVGGNGVSIGSDTVCGTINLHGVTAMVEGDMVGIGGMSEGGELNVLGANMLVMAKGPAIAGCTMNTYGGRVLAASMSAGAYPAINNGLAIKNSKMGLFASADPTALQPTKVADYLANRQPFAKIVEQVNIILPKVEHAKVVVTAQDVISGELTHFEPEDLPGADWLIYKVERFDNVFVEIGADDGYELRSPDEYLFYSIDSDKQLPADAIVVAESTWSPQMIARQPFSIFRTTDMDGQPYCELKPVGELGPGERWLWMSCDRTLAQKTGTVDGFKNKTTEEAVVAMLNSAIGRAPVGQLSLDEYGLRAQLPINQSGVGTDATFRLPADTDLVLLSKVYDGGLQDEGTVRYFNITLGLSTNLTARMEGGDSGHNDIGKEPTEEEIKNALEDAFPDPHEVTQDEDGTFRITLMEDMTGPVAIPDNLGEIVLDMNGFHITGTNGVNGADGGNALVITDSGDVGPTTELTIVEANEKYNPEGDIVGGNGADGQRPGNGGAAIRVDTKRGVTINVEGTVQVVGGKGGTLLSDDGSHTKPGAPGAGIDPQDTRGDRAPGSVQDGMPGWDVAPWAKATLNAGAPANLQSQLPDGVTVVGNELWFWKRTGKTDNWPDALVFDFSEIRMAWLKDGEVRFVAGQLPVDQFRYDCRDGIVFVGASSAAVVVKPEPVKPVDPEEKPVKPEENPDKPVVKAAVVVGKNPGIPDLGKYTVLVSTGKSIFKSTRRITAANGPLADGQVKMGVTWRNLGFTSGGKSGKSLDYNGGAIDAQGVRSLVVADCAFANLAAGEFGGAIYAPNLGMGGIITNSTFAFCEVNTENGMGGAIYASGNSPLTAGTFGDYHTLGAELTVVGSTFANNVAWSGGAICTVCAANDQEWPADLVIAGSTFGVNKADFNGGAIYAGGKVTVLDAAAGEGTLFGGNSAGIYGGALAVGGEEDVFKGTEISIGSNTVFMSNAAENDWNGEAMGGAIMLPENCTLTVRNALFTNNVARCVGGVVYGVYGGAVSTATGCTNRFEKTAFVDNRAIANGTSGDRYAFGGAISDLEGVTRVDTCVFDANVVEGETRVGAALDFEFGEETTVVNSTFRNANVEAVSVYAVLAAVIRNCVIVGNAGNEMNWYDLYIEDSACDVTYTAYGTVNLPDAVADPSNIGDCVAEAVYRGETLYLATNEYNKVAALGYPQPGVTDFVGVEYGSMFWGTSMGAFETPAIYPVGELGFEIYVDPQELAWTGTRVHPATVVVTNPYTHAELTEGVDYTVGFENDVNSTDQALVVVTGIGNYSGTSTTNYWITSYLIKYYTCENNETTHRLLDVVELGSLSGSNVVAKIEPPAGFAFDPYHEGTLTNGTVTLFDSEAFDEANGRLVLKVFYAPSGDDDVPDKYQRKVVYKVANGWWNGEQNGADKTVWVTLFDAEGKWSETGTGTLTDIPSAGNKPFSGYAKAGVWYPAMPSVEMPITRDTPSMPFFLYVYCAQPQGSTGTGRGGRGGSGSTTPTQADLDALRSHLEAKFTIKKFATADDFAQMGVTAAVVDSSTGKPLADVEAADMTLKVLGTTDLTSDEWTTVAQPTTDGNGEFSFKMLKGASKQFFKLESVEK